MQTNKNYFYIFIIIFMLFFGMIFSIQTKKTDLEIKRNEERKSRIEASLSSLPIIAKAYSVYDITFNERLYGKNDTMPLPIASLAKTMSLSFALSKEKEEKPIYISKKALSQDGDFTLLEGEKWNLDDLAMLTLVCSANDGAYAILEQNKDYLNEINKKAKRIGLNSAKFYNFTGLDEGEHKAGAFASAYDANQMAIYAIKAYPNIFKATTFPEISLKSQSGIVHNVKNTNILIGKIPNLIFSKTGFTGIAGGNLTIIFRDKMGHDIAVTVLGSTFEGRFTDMEKIVNVLELSYASGN